MRVSLAVAVLMLAAPCKGETPIPDEATVVAYAKKIDVAKLDQSLQSQPLEQWLRVGLRESKGWNGT